MNKALTICSLAVIASAFQLSHAAADQKFQILTLSSRPEMVSGNEVLVQINAPEDISLGNITVQLDGTDVTSSVHPGAAAHTLLGLIAGLKLGANVLAVFDKQAQHDRRVELAIENFPIAGPIFSGPHEKPFICQTREFKLPDGTFLGSPLDADCAVKTVVTYVYKPAVSGPSTSGSQAGPAVFKVLPNMHAMPDDVAWTTTSLGEKVPYIVRIETGAINRAIYQLAVLHNPALEPQPGPLVPPREWNRRLVYSFGGGCTGGWFKQGTSIGTGSIVNDSVVGAGYAEASSTLNVFGNNCNDVIAAETMMMVKERFIKAYGKPLFTLSRGASGGAEQQLPIAGNYPGLLDGIIPGRTFPDVLANAQLILDSQLLFRYYAKTGPALSEEVKLAISGAGRLKDFADDVGRINPTALCPSQLPQPERYDSVTNRAGARCDVFDHTIAVFGRDPSTGFARRPVDNVGVQYGLAILNAGKITPSQFLDLNQSIGGYDDDGNPVSARSVADPVALRRAYQTGRVTSGGLGLAKVPIIDVRPYRDMLPGGDVHLKFHSFSLRDRLQKANGSASNEVILVGPVSLTEKMEGYALGKMDQWLTRLGKNASSEPTLDEIARAKPDDLVDSCYTNTGEQVIETQTPTGGKCNELYPTYRSPRMVAGGPATNDILKCQLKPIDFDDYKVTFSVVQKARLAEIFPSGVCDWSKPGIEQQAPLETWISF